MTDAAVSTSSPRPARQVVTVILGLALLLNAWLLTRSWNDSILDVHEFRQVQTAVSAYYIKKDGFALAYETPVLGPPWSVPMEFPTYQLSVAAVSRATGMHLEQAGRLVSVLFFYAALPALWLLLARWQLSPVVRSAVLIGFLTCPVFTFYSRTFMIESTALCLSLWFLWAFWSAVAQFSWRHLSLAIGFGVLAALTKVTTFVVFGFPATAIAVALCFDWRPGKPWIRAWRTVGAAGAGLALPVIAGYAWVRFSDQEKALNPFATFLVSTNLHDWNWGTWAQRFKVDFWEAIYATTTRDVLSEPCLVVLGLLFAVSRAARVRILACLALYFTGCLLFSNLYFIHDYYSYATAGFLMAALGILLGSLLEESRLPLAAGGALLVLALGAQLLSFSRGYANVYRRPNEPAPAFAEIIRRTTGREDVLLAFGLDWNATVPYYGERRAIMVPNSSLYDRAALAKSVAGLGARRVGAMILTGTLRYTAEFVTPNVRDLGLQPYPIASTDDMDLYLRADLHEQARQVLAGNTYPGVVFTLEKKVVPEMAEEHSFREPQWNGELTMTSPAPYAWRGPFQPSVVDHGGKPALHTHAPQELLFQPPAGALRVEAVGGLAPESYTNGNLTDGVVLQVFEELSNGRRRLLTERALDPVHRVADRTPAALTFTNDRPFQGRIVIRLDPGPLGNRNCDWGYWTSIKIY